MRRIFNAFVIGDEHVLMGGLRLMAKNLAYSDLESCDESARAPINNVNAPCIKLRIRDNVQRCGVVLCLISGTIHTSSRVTRELETAIDMQKPAVAPAMKRVNAATMSAPIRNKDAHFYSWNPSSLKGHLDGVAVVG